MPPRSKMSAASEGLSRRAPSRPTGLRRSGEEGVGLFGGGGGEVTVVGAEVAAGGLDGGVAEDVLEDVQRSASVGHPGGYGVPPSPLCLTALGTWSRPGTGADDGEIPRLRLALQGPLTARTTKRHRMQHVPGAASRVQSRMTTLSLMAAV